MLEVDLSGSVDEGFRVSYYYFYYVSITAPFILVLGDNLFVVISNDLSVNQPITTILGKC